MLVGDYYRLITAQVRPQIESITGRKFDVPAYRELVELLKKGYDPFSLDLSFKGLPAYDFLIYTRHHGFPSPLLDWSRSIYIAAFFAFQTPNPQMKVDGERSRGSAPRRAIYVWQQGKFITHGTDTLEIRRLGPNVTTHPRHVLQQCDYSLCTTFDTATNEWRFASQGKGFKLLPRMSGHLWKFTIPSGERMKVLGLLDSMNLNAYSLFGSEESLMDTVALRALELGTASSLRRRKPVQPVLE
jgi:hypothetical protein